MEHPAPRRPDREASERGLAYTLWLPDATGSRDSRGQPTRPLPAPPWPGVVIVHGAGSCKENHADYARLATASGWAALAFDQRGHGSSEGEMGPTAFDDAVAMARLLAAASGVDAARIVIRGSSMGGFVAIGAAALEPAIAGVIAICPAPGSLLARGLRRGDLEMRVADPEATELWLLESDLGDAVAQLAGRPLFLMHAEGDEQVPSYESERLFARADEPKRLLLVPGGSHRSVQHDAELQALALHWVGQRTADRGRRGPG